MSVKNYFSKLYDRHLNNAAAIVFLLFFAFVIFILYSFGDILLPLLIAIVLSYLLEWPVSWLVKFKVPRLLSVLLIFSAFISISILFFIVVIPVLKQQLFSLINSLPDMFQEGKKLLIVLKSQYPNYITDSQVTEFIDNIKNTGTLVGKYVLSFSLASISNIINIIFYLFLVPILVFLLLKDKQKLIDQTSYFMPEESSLVYKVINDVHIDMGNYIRGKFLEAIIVSIATYIGLIYFNLQYAALLSVLVGFSIFFPYVGAIVVTIPIALVGLFQMGLGSDFMQLMIVYTVIQIIDGNILVPVLMSGVIDMNPIVVILAIIFFGGVFGFWGIFFAVPLAILVRVILRNWPGYQLSE